MKYQVEIKGYTILPCYQSSPKKIVLLLILPFTAALCLSIRMIKKPILFYQTIFLRDEQSQREMYGML